MTARDFWHMEAGEATVKEILARTSVDESLIGYAVIVNGVRKTKDYVLQDGDVVNIMPMIAGG
jgi:sulfur carrier protein ThiS